MQSMEFRIFENITSSFFFVMVFLPLGCFIISLFSLKYILETYSSQNISPGFILFPVAFIVFGGLCFCCAYFGELIVNVDSPFRLWFSKKIGVFEKSGKAENQP